LAKKIRNTYVEESLTNKPDAKSGKKPLNQANKNITPLKRNDFIKISNK